MAYSYKDLLAMGVPSKYVNAGFSNPVRNAIGDAYKTYNDQVAQRQSYLDQLSQMTSGGLLGGNPGTLADQYYSNQTFTPYGAQATGMQPLAANQWGTGYTPGQPQVNPGPVTNIQSLMAKYGQIPAPTTTPPYVPPTGGTGQQPGMNADYLKIMQGLLSLNPQIPTFDPGWEAQANQYRNEISPQSYLSVLGY